MSGISGIQQGLGLDVVPSVNLIQHQDYKLDSDEWPAVLFTAKDLFVGRVAANR